MSLIAALHPWPGPTVLLYRAAEKSCERLERPLSGARDDHRGTPPTHRPAIHNDFDLHTEHTDVTKHGTLVVWLNGWM